MRSTLLSSMMVQNRAEESKQLLGKYQPDLVRDVPQDAVGSPENIEQEDKAIENQQKQSITEKTDSETKPEKQLYCLSLIRDLIYAFIKPAFGKLSVFRIKKVPEKSANGEWEIDINEIDEIQWIGSGAQGAVFLGKWRNEEVALKKVRTQRDTEIKHLQHLNHPNIVKFR